MQVHTANDGGHTIMRFDQKACQTLARRQACTSRVGKVRKVHTVLDRIYVRSHICAIRPLITYMCD